jgi:hypothetical protein
MTKTFTEAQDVDILTSLRNAKNTAFKSDQKKSKTLEDNAAEDY